MKNRVLLICLFVCVVAWGQEPKDPPISTELFFGHERVALSSSLNKTIYKNIKFNSILSAYADYKLQNGNPELVSVNSFIYKFNRLFGVSTGVQWHFKKGFIPIAAVHFSYANPTWLLVFTPYYNFLPYNGAEAIAIVEFKPQINETLRLFTRAQGFFGFNIDKKVQERGMAYFRLGLTVKQKYTVGLAANLDFYGPKAKLRQNYGGFLTLAL